LGDRNMDRISFEERPGCLIMRIEGRLVDHFADEAKHLILGRQLAPELIVDLSEVTFADAHGEDALKWLTGIGARFLAESSYSLHLCERVNLPLKDAPGHQDRAQPSKREDRRGSPETNLIIRNARAPCV